MGKSGGDRFVGEEDEVHKMRQEMGKAVWTGAVPDGTTARIVHDSVVYRCSAIDMGVIRPDSLSGGGLEVVCPNEGISEWGIHVICRQIWTFEKKG